MRLNKFLSGLAAVLLAFSLCNAASATPLTKIRTAWMDSYETFAMWYAKEKGWDKEAGLDIDILFCDSRIIDTPRLTVPHPRMAQRNFVLCPLNEIMPDFMHPVLRKKISELLQESPDTLKTEIIL